MKRPTIQGFHARWGLVLAGLLLAGLAGCGGSSTTAATTPGAATTFQITASSSTGHLPNAIAGSPYAYGFQTNQGQAGVTAILPITFSVTAALPPGLTLTSQGVLAGTPTQPGSYSVSIQATDSSSVPQVASFVYLMSVTLPGATLTAVAHTDLGGHGQNADVTVATATATQVPYAYVGTRGSPGDCPATGVKIVNISQITNPTLVTTAGAVSGASQQEARVATGVSSPSFHPDAEGDLMAITEQPCNSATATPSQTGVQFVDVSDPTHPQLLGTWSSGLDGVGDVALLPIPGPANSLGQVNESLSKIYALVAVPNSETSGGEGDLRVLDVTNPALPQEVGNWGVLAATDTLLPQAVMGQDQAVFLDTIELSSDQKTAYLGYMDEGVVVMDVSNPAAIRSTNSAILLDHITYPPTAVATSTTPSSPEGNTHQALPVVNDSELLITDEVCASAMSAQNTPLNPAVNVVCGAGSAVTLSSTAGWGYLRTYNLPTPSSAALESFFATPQSMSDPAPDTGIYTAHNIAWNGNTVDPHAYIAWFSSGVVDLDVTSISPPTQLAAWAPPDTPDPNGSTPGVDNPAKALVYGVAAYSYNGEPYVLASDINSGLWIVQEAPGPQLTILTTTLPDGNVGVPYYATLTAVNGVIGNSKLTFQVDPNSNPLPSGLSMDNSGNITGTPAVAGSVDVTFDVEDGTGGSSEQTIPMTIVQNLAIVPPAPMPQGTLDEPFNLTLTAVNGTSPYTWSVTNSALPTGMSLSASAGTISGTPATSGDTVTTIQVSDSSTPTLTATLPLTFNVTPIEVETSGLTLSAGTVGTAYSESITMANGIGPFTPAVISGALPPGLALSSGPGITEWTISGTPTTSGTYSFGVQITDSATPSQSAIQPYTLVINPFEIEPTVLPSGVVGRGYEITLTPQGGTSPYTLVLQAGALPTGLSLDSEGELFGVPAAGSAGNYSFTVRGEDATGLIATATYPLVIFTGNTFAITTTGLPAGQAGQAYSQVIAADFGTPPYTFSLESGNLPAGITLAPNGTLAGTPGATSAGTYRFTVEAVDNTGLVATEQFIWSVVPPNTPQ